MDSNYKYGFSPSAIEDITTALDYISNILVNPSAAEALYQKIFARIEQNLTFPHGCADCTIYGITNRRIRHIRVDNYILFLRIDEETKIVWIIRFLYSARDIKPELPDN